MWHRNREIPQAAPKGLVLVGGVSDFGVGSVKRALLSSAKANGGCLRRKTGSQLLENTELSY